MAEVKIARTVEDLRAHVLAWRAKGETVGLIPTMGGLHEGHLSLVRRAKEDHPKAVATIFVNPKQFDRKEDLNSYPRDEARDLALLEQAGCDLLFAPLPEVVYPEDFVSKVSLSGLSECLDGLHRPGHFDGVTTVVCKLFMMAQTNAAYFGEKDYQQLLIVKRMVQDLNMPIEVLPVETKRDEKGLALSSRNFNLTAGQRLIAPKLYQTLSGVAEELRGQGSAPPGKVQAKPLLRKAVQTLGQAGFNKVDYIELRCGLDLRELKEASPSARLFAAAWLGSTRLIDNIPLY